MFQVVNEADNDKNYDLHFLQRINFDDIDKLDPNCQQGYMLYYSQVVPVDIELDEKQDEGYDQTITSLNFKIYVKDDYMTPKSIKIEVTTEEDVEFYYNSVIGFPEFDQIKYQDSLGENVLFTEPSAEEKKLYGKSCMGSKYKRPYMVFEDMLKNLLQDIAR